MKKGIIRLHQLGEAIKPELNGKIIAAQQKINFETNSMIAWSPKCLHEINKIMTNPIKKLQHSTI